MNLYASPLPDSGSTLIPFSALCRLPPGCTIHTTLWRIRDARGKSRVALRCSWRQQGVADRVLQYTTRVAYFSADDGEYLGDA